MPTIPIELLSTPAYAPGFLVKETLRDGLRVKVTDTVTFSATSPVTTVIAHIPANTYIESIVAEIITTYVGTSEQMTVGDDTVATAFGTLTTANLETAGGWIKLSGAKNYAVPASLQVVESNATVDTSAGAVRFWITYRTNSNVGR